MARQAWERTITDNAGNVLTGVQVTVFLENGSTLATIYSQQNGGAALANPFNTGVQTSAKFYADPGRYVVRVFKDGNTKEFTDVDIAGKAVRDDIGTAAYLTATTSTTDPTQGRAMRSGDYGIGATGDTGIYSGDISSIASTGIYSGGPATTGGPAGVSLDGAKIVHLKWADPNSSTQTVYTYAGPSYSRNITGGVPLAWRQEYSTANIIGAVAFSGGQNTGAIIERGANSNGEYVKFADGLMICKRYRVGDIPMSAGYGITGLYYGGFTWDFPAVFAHEQPAVSGTGSDPSRIGWVSAYNVGLGGCSPVYFTGSASVNPCGVFLIAVGRWR